MEADTRMHCWVHLRMWWLYIMTHSYVDVLTWPRRLYIVMFCRVAGMTWRLYILAYCWVDVSLKKGWQGAPD